VSSICKFDPPSAAKSAKSARTLQARRVLLYDAGVHYTNSLRGARTRVNVPKPILPLALTLGCVLFSSSNAPAQQDTTPPTLQQELQRLGVAATALDHTLPSFTCQETVVSQRLQGKKLLQQTNFTATIRANRAADGTLAESYQPTTLNGKPISGSAFGLPVYVAGGFDRAMIYFLPSLQPCYRYKLSPGRIDFETTPHSASPLSCEYIDTHGFALLDATGNITHLERRVSPKSAIHLHLAPFAAFDFADIHLNDRTYRLAHHMQAEVAQNGFVGRFDATYTDCHLYTATVTIGPASEVPQSDTPQPQ
jgi:hypothetical protein